MTRRFISQVTALRRNPLAWGSFLMMGSSILANFLNYVFNVVVVRLLGPSNYGVFASLISLLTIFSVPAAALTIATTKFTAEFKGQSSDQKIHTLLSTLIKILLIGGAATFLVLTAFSSQIASFLNIKEVGPVILVGAAFLVILPQTATLGVLQGLQSFLFLSLNSIFSAIVKLVGGLGLVFLGYSVVGALSGFLLALFLPFLVSLFALRRFFGRGRAAVDWSSFIRYTPSAALSALGLSLLITTDIILVKHFFSSFEAGIYSSLSLVGRVILFFSSPISVVMFPIIAERHSGRKDYHRYLFYSLSLVALASLLITAFYFLFPIYSVKFFFGEKFLPAAPYLGFFGIFITFYSLSNVLVSFFLSIHKTKVSYFLMSAAALQWLLINLFHRNFSEVVFASLFVSALLTITLLLYLLLDDDFRNRSRLQAGKDD